MGLFRFLWRLLFGTPPARPSVRAISRRRRTQRVRLVPLRRMRRDSAATQSSAVETDKMPYRFARFGVARGGYLDLSRDGNDARLSEFGLPVLRTPQDLADWCGIRLGKLAWLIDRFTSAGRPEHVRQSHYFYQWLKKRSGGLRLIEAPKPVLKNVQQHILHDLLSCIPVHDAAHGFAAGRSILTNAAPHTGQRVVLKMDLENFYPSVRFSRVVAIFRSVGYSRESANWLARLTTSALPANMPFPDADATAILPYLPRHLPQGAPTSPALANLSAYSLDVRLNGLARSFGARYTRYADDLTFSGSQRLCRALPVFIPLATQVIRAERFRVNRGKRQVLRSNQRQIVTGVVVNQKTNVARREFDRLKATLTNCVRSGPSSQNRESRTDFAAHLQGRIAHVNQLNPTRGRQLRALFDRIDWMR